ncbi:MAG: hypothetical protein ACRC5C_09130 [Bacilli bacterium]
MSKQLDEMKKQYDETPIPAELESRVQQALIQSLAHRKKEARKIQHLAAGAASVAAVAILSITLSIFPNIAQQVSGVPIIGSLAQTLTIGDEMSNQAEGFQSTSPTSDQPKVAESAPAGLEGAARGFSQTLPYEVVVNEQTLSIKLYNTSVAPGVATFNFSVVDGKQLVLGDLFKNDRYIPIINGEIQKQWPSFGLAENASFDSIVKDQLFYITSDGSLVVVVNAQNGSGLNDTVVDVRIPTAALTTVVKEKSLLK